MKYKTLLAILLLGLSMVSFGQSRTPIGKDLGTTRMSDEALQSVFRGNNSIWNNQNPVTVVLTSSNSKGFELTAQWALDSDGFEFQKHWLSLVFQGRANAPVFLKEESEVVTYVQEHPGAIGILYDTTAPAELVIEVK